LFCSTFAFLFLKYCQVLDAYLGVTERACIRWKNVFCITQKCNKEFDTSFVTFRLLSFTDLLINFWEHFYFWWKLMMASVFIIEKWTITNYLICIFILSAIQVS
jgi:hypothetical protein